jgi:hypothetical protein
VTAFEKVGVLYVRKFGSKHSLSPSGGGSQSLDLPAYEDGTDSVPKRWHLNYRRRGITQKKAYDITNDFGLVLKNFTNKEII